MEQKKILNIFVTNYLVLNSSIMIYDYVKF